MMRGRRFAVLDGIKNAMKLADTVDIEFDKLGRALDIEVDEFDKIMSNLRSMLDSCEEQIRVTSRAINREPEVVKTIEDTLRKAENILKRCAGINQNFTRVDVMDLLRDKHSKLQMVIEDHNFVIKEEMILRQKEMEEIVRLLLEDSNSKSSSPVSIFSIHGKPGSGKTSLVYYLYHHKKIRLRFDQRSWISWEDISGIRSGEEILRIIKQTPGLDAKYLLVLEDLSNKDGEKWFDLLKPLLSVLAKFKLRTKILVTSSSTSLQPHVFLKLPLAKGAPYLLGPLHRDDSLAFFQSIIAFRGIAEEDRNPYLNFALELFNRCNTNDLRVIRMVASSLSSQLPSTWQYFIKVVFNLQDPAKHILSILDLIMQQPQLFGCLSLFPFDYEFSKVEIYQLWDALENITQDSKEMFETLLGKEDIFRCCKRDKSGTIVYYKLKKLVHEVVKHLARDKYHIVENVTEKVHCFELQHLSFIVCSYWTYPSWLSKSKDLKSLLLLPTKSCRIITAPNLDSLLGFHLRTLQALDLSFVDCRYCLPIIECLEHLRYLRLGVSSESLPERITHLKFLQTLDLRRSKVQELPRGFHKLCLLKHLYIGDRLIDLPPRFGELTELQTLDVFIVGNNNGLDALASSYLSGKLRIRYQKGREVHVLTEDTTLLKDTKLHELSLEWSSSNAGPAAEKYKKEDDMELELLQPPSTLKILTVKNWKGERFPKWAMDHFSSLLSNLVFLHIADCTRCKHLPSFSKIGCLNSLELWGLIALEWIEDYDNKSMVSSETPYFPSLEHLSLVNLPRLKGWSRVEEHNADYEQEKQRNLPRLNHLRLSGCPELISMPDMPTLLSLEVSNCHRDLLQHFLSVQASAAVSSSSASAVVPVLQNLRSLKMSDMSIPEPLPRGLDCLTTLEELSLSWLYNLRILPESIGHLIQLRQLAIRYLPNLLDLPKSLAGLSALEHVEIRYCPRLKQVPSYFSELKWLKQLQIKECVNLERRCQQPDGEDYSTHP